MASGTSGALEALLSTEVKSVVIDQYRLEWLDTSNAEENFYAKNDMVAAVKFAEVQQINGARYKSARLSVENAESYYYTVLDTGAVPLVRYIATCSESNFFDQGYISGKDYLPSVYTVTLLKYSGPTQRSAHHLTYDVKQGTTAGELIDKFISLKMHHFILFTLHRRRSLEGMRRPRVCPLSFSETISTV